MFDFYFRELAFFYPDFVAPTVIQKRKKKRLQRTLALIRPDALRTRKGTCVTPENIHISLAWFFWFDLHNPSGNFTLDSCVHLQRSSCMPKVSASRAPYLGNFGYP